jgi:hypothetical protein
MKIGDTEISLVKENVFKVETSKLILDSINDNMERNNINVNMSTSTSTSTSTKNRKTRIYNSVGNNVGNIEAEIRASSVMPLTKFLLTKENKNGVSFDIILHFIGNIGNQLTFLKNRGYSIPFFSLEDIIVLNGIVFAFVNNDKVFKIERSKITIDYPILYDASSSFIPPNIGFHHNKDDGDDGDDGDGDSHEMKLPMYIHFSSAYYSLAQMCMYVFLRKNIKNEEDYNKEASPFIYTSLYWCLKRCLDKDENRRILLYV